MISLKKTLKVLTEKVKALDTALSVDYIVEQGTEGIWTYRKWNSGIAECWGRDKTSLYYGTSYPNGGYYTSSARKTDYPFTFNSIESVQACCDGDWNMLLYIDRDSNSYVKTLWLADVKKNRTTNINIYVKGTWK